MLFNKPLFAQESKSGRVKCVASSLAITILASSCGGGDDIACTAEARTSVLLTVVDQFNAPLPGVTATYQVNGGSSQTQQCEANGSCALAFEVSGIFTVTAAKAGYVPAFGSVTVTRDECHVNTAPITLTLASNS